MIGRHRQRTACEALGPDTTTRARTPAAVAGEGAEGSAQGGLGP